MRRFEVLIVGSGHAGAQAAIALRQAKWNGTLAMISEDAELPYERPPLSKAYLAGEKDFGRILIRHASFWIDREVSFLPSRRVVSVDVSSRVVTTGDGETIGYGKLIWAAGGTPRRLVCSGHDLQGIHTVRTRADVDQMMGELKDATRIVVIGGGYIGLEAAAVLTKLGKSVVLLEAQDRVLARVAGADLSRFFEHEHRMHGVDLRLNVQVDCILERRGRACGVLLASGETLEAEMVIVGIGIVPAVSPLIEAGAEGNIGVNVDGQCRTSLPDVFAIGDCALHVNVYGPGTAIRVESVQNANDQAVVAARFIAGQDVNYTSLPWFWSDQYDLKLQTIGLSTGYDEVVVRGIPDSRKFSIIYLKKGCVIAVDAINYVKDYVQGRRLIEKRCHVSTKLLRDTSIPLAEIAGLT